MWATIIHKSQIIKKAHQYCRPNALIVPKIIVVAIIVKFLLLIKKGTRPLQSLTLAWRALENLWVEISESAVRVPYAGMQHSASTYSFDPCRFFQNLAKPKNSRHCFANKFVANICNKKWFGKTFLEFFCMRTALITKELRNYSSIIRFIYMFHDAK